MAMLGNLIGCRWRCSGAMRLGKKLVSMVTLSTLSTLSTLWAPSLRLLQVPHSRSCRWSPACQAARWGDVEIRSVRRGGAGGVGGCSA